MRFLYVVASATVPFLEHAVKESTWMHEFLPKTSEAEETSDVSFDPICSWAQGLLKLGCDDQYPDHSTGCAMGVVTGKPFTKDMKSQVYCLTNNQPFLHFGNPQCSYNSDSQGSLTVTFNCQWLVQPAGIGAIIASMLFCCGCLVCVCRRCGGRQQRTVYIYRN
jgi:hypothetical protein